MSPIIPGTEAGPRRETVRLGQETFIAAERICPTELLSRDLAQVAKRKCLADNRRRSSRFRYSRNTS
jgi:hypothetical protein